MLLEKMGSRIELGSECGEGSIFHFTAMFPTEKDDTIVNYDLSHIHKVLIVDDNASSRSILQNMLVSRGIMADVAVDGAEALDMVGEQVDYDLVVVDHNMPSMDGLKLVRIMREMPGFTTTGQAFIILHNSSDSSSIYEGYKELGIRSIFVKPVKMSQLFETIAHANSPEGDLDCTEDSAKRGEPCVLHRRYTIMVAEDNEVNMTLASAILSICLPDAEIIKAVDGNEAVRAFKDTEPDLVFMDIQMPGRSGYEAASAIREIEAETSRNGSHIPIIALTAGTAKGERERCLDSGMDDYITKPVIAETIRGVLQKWLPEFECTSRFADIGSSDAERFNREQLLASIDGNLELFNTLTSIAMTTFAQGLEDITTAHSQKDMQDVKKRAHKIKGSALNMGCTILAEMAARLEEAVELDEGRVWILLQEMRDEIALIEQDMESKA
jgi:CheY-like chemotaxis protein/HPt (histidine-containing phosphotransfer) domain-containing protein